MTTTITSSPEKKVTDAAGIQQGNLPRTVGVFTICDLRWTLTQMQRSILLDASHVIQNDPNFLSTVFVPILTQEMGLSLRALDWLTTNYSKRYHLRIGTYDVHNGYKKVISTYRRKNFDPFRRNLAPVGIDNSITFMHDGVLYTTTVAQVNFILWTHRRGLIHYAKQHVNAIEHDMNSATHGKTCRRPTRSHRACPKLQTHKTREVKCPYRCIVTRDREKNPLGRVY